MSILNKEDKYNTVWYNLYITFIEKEGDFIVRDGDVFDAMEKAFEVGYNLGLENKKESN